MIAHIVKKITPLNVQEVHLLFPSAGHLDLLDVAIITIKHIQIEMHHLIKHSHCSFSTFLYSYQRHKVSHIQHVLLHFGRAKKW